MNQRKKMMQNSNHPEEPSATETTRENTDSHENNATVPETEPKKKVKGHGRLNRDAYQGAVVFDIVLTDLKPGDTCPEEACDGRLYEMSEPGVFIQITGNPATATRYNLQKLRCAICELIFTAPLPEGVEDTKYTNS